MDLLKKYSLGPGDVRFQVPKCRLTRQSGLPVWAGVGCPSSLAGWGPVLFGDFALNEIWHRVSQPLHLGLINNGKQPYS